MSPQTKLRCLVVIVSCSFWLPVGIANAANGQAIPNSQEGGPNASQLRDITGIERTPVPPTSRVGQMAAAFAVAVLAILALSTWGIRRLQTRPKPSLSVSQRALDELERLGELGSKAGSTVEAYHTRLSDIIRRYLQAGFNIPATQRTNEEFFGLLQTGQTLAPEQREVLVQFLRRCDMAKFAAAQFTASECETARCLARHFVHATSTDLNSSGVH
jgi:hypothetical protein